MECILTDKGKELPCKAMKNLLLQRLYLEVVPRQKGGTFAGLRRNHWKRRQELLTDFLLRVSGTMGQDVDAKELVADGKNVNK